MTPRRYEQVRDLFMQVCELEPMRRSAILDEKCADDPELRTEVEALIREEDNALLRESRAGLAAEFASAAAQQHGIMPDRIGKYRIIRKIGEGGMGWVFEAQQDHPHRTVALKVVRPGVVSEPMIRRFAHEAHVLGLLRHPGIAQIHDAAAAETAYGMQPFFVMELVHGRPLLQYARGKSLSVRQRLEIMASIADAVHHAHTKGVIHRDLKPSNILIDETTTPAQPKILDFGVARATESDLRATTIHTDVGQLVGTVPYMSPEQASGDGDQIDTRSDVYALGVICFELLAGRLPYPIDRARMHEAVRAIREDEPTRLSAIDRVYRGDIETIVAKALGKDKERRYQSAADFAADIRRYLQDEPIVARRASALYQFRKFAKRNKALVGGVAGIMLALSGGVIATSAAWMQAVGHRQSAQEAEELARKRLAEMTAAYDKASMEEKKARAVTEFFQAMLAGAGPMTAAGHHPTVRELLNEQFDEAVKHIAATPEIEAAVQMAAGVAFLELGEYERAREILSAASQTRAAILGPDHPDTLNAMKVLAAAHLELSDFPRARALYEEVHRRASANLGPDEDLTLSAANGLARTLHELGDWEAAEAMLTDTLDRRRRTSGEHAAEALTCMNNLALLYLDRGQFQQAETLYRKVIGVSKVVKGEHHPHTLISTNALADVLYRMGRTSEAMAVIDAALEKIQHVLGKENPTALNFLQTRAMLLSAMGELKESIALNRAVVEAAIRTLGDKHQLTMIAMNSLAVDLQNAGEYSEAADWAERALAVAHELLGADNPQLSQYMIVVARSRQFQGNLAEAANMYREILAHQHRTLGADHLEKLVTMNNLGHVLQRMGQFEESVDVLRKVVHAREEQLGSEHPQTLTSINNLALALQGLRRLDESHELLQRVHGIRTRALGPDHPETLTSLNNFGLNHFQRGDFAEAENVFRNVVEDRRRVLGNRHPMTLTAMRNLAASISRQGRTVDAISLYEELQDTRRNLLGEKHPDTILAMRDLANAYSEVGRVDDAVRVLDLAHTFALEVYPQGDLNITTIDVSRGDCYRRLQKFDEAERILLASYESLMSTFGQQHQQTQRAIGFLINLYEDQQLSEKADKYRTLRASTETAAR